MHASKLISFTIVAVVLLHITDGFDEASITADVLGKLSDTAGSVLSALHIVPYFGIAAKFLSMGFSFLSQGLSDRDRKQEQIMRGFAELKEKISGISSDIKRLEQVVKWQTTRIQFGDVVLRIRDSSRIYSEIISAGNDSAKQKRYEDRLKEDAGNRVLWVAVESLMLGMRGGDIFISDIFTSSYEVTGGNRSEIDNIAKQLLPLVFLGLASLMKVETLLRGKDAQTDVEQYFASNIANIQNHINDVRDRCVREHRANMENDLEKALSASQSNKELSANIRADFVSKYDWLDLYAIVYDDVTDERRFSLSGNVVQKLHFNKKCAAVFYHNKSTDIGSSDAFSHNETRALTSNYSKYAKPTKAVNCSTNGVGAKAVADQIECALDRNATAWWGLAVVRRFVDLWACCNYEREVMTVGDAWTICLLLE